jgi:hypothetical protein
MAEPAAKDAKNAKYRPYRIAAYAFYLVVAVTFSLAITVNVVRSTLAMTPDRPPPSNIPMTPEQCSVAARSLWRELDGHRKGLSEAPKVSSADVTWTAFRIDWLTRAHENESRCTRGDDREAQRKIFRELDSLMDLYTTHTVQFAGEIGPTIDALNADLASGTK